MRLESAPLESASVGKLTFLKVLEPLSQNAILVTLHCNEKVSQGEQVSRTLVSFHFSREEREHSPTVRNSCIQQPFQLLHSN